MTGKQLRAIRKRHGLTQAELALRLGVTTGAVGHWETGLAKISKLAAAAILAIDKRGRNTKV